MRCRFFFSKRINREKKMSGRKDVLEMAGIRKKGKKNPKRGL
jgi:hypothetical protein